MGNEMSMSAWQTKTDEHGWTTHTRGNARITVSPKSKTVRLNCSGITSEHPSVDAAKRAAARTPNRGW